MACAASNRLLDSLLFVARSTEYLQLYHRKRYAPSRAKWLLLLANTQNCIAWRVQSIRRQAVRFSRITLTVTGLRRPI